ncbi:MAG: copper chaperone PCu(A)C [Woeseiaceae bacterium]
MMFRLLLLSLTICVSAACSNDQPPLVAENVVITQPIPGMRMSAGYMTLHNSSDSQILINRIESPDLESVQMHETVLDDGISRMRPLPMVAIPAGQAVTFEAGGKHLMLRHLSQTPDTVRLQLFSDETLILSINVNPEE